MTAPSRGYGASDKLTFLLSLVPYLMDHDRVSVSEVAEHFGVPADRVRDAVSLIAMSGVPGETHQYLHGDLFDIQWDEFENNDTIVLTHLVAIDDSPRFSAREAAAMPSQSPRTSGSVHRNRPSYTPRPPAPSLCPECAAPLARASACVSCPQCGWGHCG